MPENAYDRYLAGLDSTSSFVPPNTPAANVDPPRMRTLPERQAAGGDFLRRASAALGLIPKASVNAFSMTAEGLGRVDDAFQVTVATMFGRIPTSQYPTYVREVMNGQRKVPGTEWMRIMVGQETWDAIKDSSLIPGWTKRVVATDAYLGQTTQLKPKVT